jgi:hypothetical protein
MRVLWEAAGRTWLGVSYSLGAAPSAQRLKATSASRAPKANDASCSRYRSKLFASEPDICCSNSHVSQSTIVERSPLNAGVSVGRVSAPYSGFSIHRISCIGYRFSPMRRATPSPPRLVRGSSHNAYRPTTLSASACRRLENRQHTLDRRRCSWTLRPPNELDVSHRRAFCIDVSAARSGESRYIL